MLSLSIYTRMKLQLAWFERSLTCFTMPLALAHVSCHSTSPAASLAWLQVILLSDGSVTRHLQLMTNQRVEVRTAWKTFQSCRPAQYGDPSAMRSLHRLVSKAIRLHTLPGACRPAGDGFRA